ncbi:MAG: hypothetical protein OXN89_15770 [Bryobacterales bacterium]|nr:hypothetical protein [Bryobacterales bacterium]
MPAFSTCRMRWRSCSRNWVPRLASESSGNNILADGGRRASSRIRRLQAPLFDELFEDALQKGRDLI